MAGEIKYPAYRWVILAMGWALTIFNNGPRMAFPPLANALIADLDITLTQYVMLVSGPMVVAIFSPVPGGLIGDRFGFKAGVAFSMIIGSVCFIAMSFAPNYWVLLTISCVTGLGFGAMFPSLGKLVSVWFPPKEIGLATGIYMLGMSIGMSLGMATIVPIFGTDWRKAMLTLGIALFVLVVLWFIFARDKPAGIELPKHEEASMMDGLGLAIKSRNVWLIGIVTALTIGPFLAIQSLLPKALADVHHVAPATAGVVVSLFTFSRLVSDPTVPKLSDRVGLRRPFLLAGALGSAVCVYLAWHFAMSPATWVLLSLGGIFYTGVGILVLAVPLEIPEVGNYKATSTSIAAATGHFGAFVIPTFAIAPIVERWGFSTAFAASTALLASGAIFVLLLEETGWRASHHRQHL